ncbi:MAG: hypothetical protein HQK54_18415 [Oligoflexales bacterium]|nr:hypothetical protein [Oligoflexales bacterium]
MGTYYYFSTAYGFSYLRFSENRHIHFGVEFLTAKDTLENDKNENDGVQEVLKLNMNQMVGIFRFFLLKNLYLNTSIGLTSSTGQYGFRSFSSEARTTYVKFNSISSIGSLSLGNYYQLYRMGLTVDWLGIGTIFSSTIKLSQENSTEPGISVKDRARFFYNKEPKDRISSIISNQFKFYILFLRMGILF